MRRAVLAMILLLVRAAPDALAQHTVSGTAFDAAGAPLEGSVRLIVRRSTAVPRTPVVTTLTSDGTFALTNVPPGEYLVQALGAPGPGRPAVFGVEQVSVIDRDPRPVTIRASAGAVLEGLIVVEGQPQSRAATVSLVARPFDVDRAPEIGHGTLAVYGDGRFYLTGLYGRARLALATTSEGWYLESVRISGIDATHRGFGGTAGGSAVLVFSTDRDRWFATSNYLKRAQVSPDGSFRVHGLPPGDYHVAAVNIEESVDSGNWQEPEALQALTSSALRVTLDESQPYVTDVSLIQR